MPSDAHSITGVTILGGILTLDVLSHNPQMLKPRIWRVSYGTNISCLNIKANMICRSPLGAWYISIVISYKKQLSDAFIHRYIVHALYYDAVKLDLAQNPL